MEFFQAGGHMIIAVIGAGPAGLMASVRAAECGAKRVLLFEKNDNPGRKLLMTGNGRCNVSNSADIRSYPEYYFGNGKFLYKALHAFSPSDLRNFFAACGVQLKEEDGGRLFPVTDQAKDVLHALLRRSAELGVEIHTEEPVTDIKTAGDGKVSGVVTARTSYDVDACVLTTGGSSWPGTGSTGDGYRLAARLGHGIVALKAGLAPLDTIEAAAQGLQGVALRNAALRAFSGGNELACTRGDILFTHTGLTGPAVFRISRVLPVAPEEYGEGNTIVAIDLLPEQNGHVLRETMTGLLLSNQNRMLINVLKQFGPESYMACLMTHSGIERQMFCRDLKKESREKLLSLMKSFPLTVKKPPSMAAAMVTAGGVSLKEVDPKTMESKIVPGLFFAGEVLDLDGDTGGFNLQAAFSTGYAAGTYAAEH